MIKLVMITVGINETHFVYENTYAFVANTIINRRRKINLSTTKELSLNDVCCKKLDSNHVNSKHRNEFFQ